MRNCKSTAFYPASAPVPEGIRTECVLLRPLRATDGAHNYAAVMASAEQLHRWSQITWPADDFTVAQNLADLQGHECEHIERQAFSSLQIEL